ncbi:MAG: hypothetical protein NZ895_01910 [Archaeoglobaceae archaeon]|nr:hypothetical protein [Archaeoglobaceae archaeon]MCX8151562.1 hypothetical protein [Archaeoglobaceae archaeon]MDW8013160.1 RNase P subunit p30 family protein [Archaeoglobaceae archaeon]
MFDFIRFTPTDLPDLGFKSYVIFDGKCAIALTANNAKELREKLKKIKDNILVGVVGKNPEVCREAIMRKKVDILLDCIERELDYATIKLAAEKDVTIELGLSKFLKSNRSERLKLFDALRTEIKVINKFDTPFVVSSAAENMWEMRTRKQIEMFFSFFGCNILKARKSAERVVRRYFDKNYIMDGFEILE